ncbi:MAG: flippase-like domain-containing protein [Acidobacteria bacterium]|nr:flippase-like domain-containing protein [Acidobacteriota bacterium]
MSGDRAPRIRQAFGAAVAVALIAGTLWLAGPAKVSALVIGVTPAVMGWALAAAAGSLIFRGLRLSLLLPPGALSPFRAVPIAAVAQAAALFVPARLGELALPWLLRRDIGRDGASGVATLLVARTLDTAALGAWAGVAILFRWGLGAPAALAAAAALLLPVMLLPVIIAGLDRWVGTRKHGWTSAGVMWADRLHRIRRGLDDARKRPVRLTAAAAACMGSWAFQWTLAWYLLAAMGFRWPVWDVVTGSAVASISNLLPFNLVANIGTLEAGWTAAFAAMGVNLDIAAATGLACHVWALIFTAVFGGIGWLVLGPANLTGPPRALNSRP